MTLIRLLLLFTLFTAAIDDGSGLDPHGGRQSAPPSGSCIDPLGGCNYSDGGGGMDPNG